MLSFVETSKKPYPFDNFVLSSIINSFNTVMIITKKLLTKIDPNKIYRTIPVNLIYLVPCYNESQTELTDTLDSLSEQLSTQSQDKKLLIIICDGKVKGAGNNKNTNKYYLIVPTDSNININLDREDKCGIDLGVRTFATVYSPNNSLEIGTNLTSTIDKYNKKMDKIHDFIKGYCRLSHPIICHSIEDFWQDLLH